MRVLLVTHPPLEAESGASQIALNLAAALIARGHEAVAWSPEPLAPGTPPGTRWWRRWAAQRAAIERFAADAGPWDAIDLPGVSASPRLARLAPLVARSVQPELLYSAADLRAQIREPRVLLHLPYAASFALALRRGWGRSRLIACLGAQELGWMRRRYPALAPKLRHYVTAPSPADRAALERVRRERAPRRPGAGVRFLWIGRWAAHKGPGRLLAFVRRRAAAFPEDTFTVAGCGPAAARDCPPGLLADGRLRLVPSFRREELPALLAGHDAGLFTSSVEGWGLCLNEMLEAGLPVAATPAGGVEDLRPFWGPRLLPFPPPAEIPRDSLDLAALDRYLAHFSWPEIARRYEEEVLLPATAGGGAK